MATGIAGTLADLAATGEPVLVVCADVPAGARTAYAAASAASPSARGRRWSATRS